MRLSQHGAGARLGIAIVALAAGAAVFIVDRPAVADDESDRDRILEQIDARLGSAASALAGVASDSDDGDIREADSYVDEVGELAQQLDDVKGDDSRARDVVDRYPGYVERFHRADAALDGMKGYQRSNVSLMKVCEDADQKLVAQAREYERTNDPDGLEQLPRLAADARTLALRFLDEADRFGSQMEDWKRTAQAFDAGDGRWSDVRSALQRDAGELLDFWKHDRATADERCKDLKAGPDHPVVREVLGKLAGGATGRKEVIDNLNKLVGELAGTIRDVPGASGVDSVDRVREKLDAIDASLAVLERARGADPKAKEIGDRWPAVARKARELLEPFKELKQFQHDLDPLPVSCRDLEAKLDGFIATNGDDADGLDTIPAYATELGTPTIVATGKAKERLLAMSAARAKVMAFTSSEGPWSQATAAFGASADTIYKYVDDKHEESLAACQQLVKTTEHPKVKAALDRLRASSGSAIDVLTREVNEWVAAARTTYRLDCESMTTMWDAYCGFDWEPDDENPDDLPQQTAAHLQDVNQAAMGPLLAKLPDLQTRAKALVKKRDTKDRAQVLVASLAKEEERLARLYSGSTWHGVNDPLKFYATEYGKAAHRRMESEYRCDVADVAFPGSRPRPDCIKAEGCIILEFKSQNDKAKDDGENQLGIYRGIVTAYYQGLLDRKEMPDSDHGGEAIMKAFEANGCINDKHLVLNTKVEPYVMCEKRYHCVED